MSPRALLFSSDEETSTRLGQALAELENDVLHCAEIFAAIEQVTSHSFGVIACDWDDGIEAGFLLKTSRELKSSRDAVTVAVVNDAGSAVIARQIGADVVLTKPISCEKAKYALLSCDAYLAALKSWLPELLAKQNHPDPASSGAFPPFGSGAMRAEMVGNDHHELFGYSRAQTSRRWFRPPLVIPAAVILFVCSLVYLTTQPLRGEVANTPVANLFWHDAERTRSSGGGTDSMIDGRKSSSDRRSDREFAQIRVTPVYPSSWTTVKRVSSAAEVPAAHNELAFAVKPSIPESLRTSLTPGIESTVARAGPAMLDAMRPVVLPTEVARHLLLQAVQPTYPEQALRAGMEGPVTFLASIGKDGRIEELKLVRGYFVLAEAAYQALRQWRYKPYVLDGQAVEAQTYVTIDFRRQ